MGVSGRYLPPPFLTLFKGVDWDLVTYPPPDNAVDVGNRVTQLSFEAMQHWQMRQGYYDVKLVWTDTQGGPAFTRDYGDPPTPIEDFPDWLSRELNAFSFSYSVQFGPIGPGADNIIINSGISMGSCTTKDGSVYWPRIELSGNTYAQVNGLGIPARYSSSPQISNWIGFGTASVLDDIGNVFPIPLYVEPLPAGTIDAYYVPTIYEIRPFAAITS